MGALDFNPSSVTSFRATLGKSLPLSGPQFSYPKTEGDGFDNSWSPFSAPGVYENHAPPRTQPLVDCGQPDVSSSPEFSMGPCLLAHLVQG